MARDRQTSLSPKGTANTPALKLDKQFSWDTTSRDHVCIKRINISQRKETHVLNLPPPPSCTTFDAWEMSEILTPAPYRRSSYVDMCHEYRLDVPEKNSSQILFLMKSLSELKIVCTLKYLRVSLVRELMNFNRHVMSKQWFIRFT